MLVSQLVVTDLRECLFRRPMSSSWSDPQPSCKKRTETVVNGHTGTGISMESPDYKRLYLWRYQVLNFGYMCTFVIHSLTCYYHKGPRPETKVVNILLILLPPLILLKEDFTRGQIYTHRQKYLSRYGLRGTFLRNFFLEDGYSPKVGSIDLF